MPSSWLSGKDKFIVFSALCFASPAACCWCRVSCCFFLEMKSFGFDEIQSLQVTPGYPKPIVCKEKRIQDQSMKGCSVDSER